MGDNGKNIVITGIGLISGLGIGKDVNWEKMTKGISGIRKIKRFDPANLQTQIGGELTEDFEEAVKAKVKKMTQKRTAGFTQLAILGAELALEDSGLNLEDIDRNRAGVILGNCMGGIEYLEKKFRHHSSAFEGENIKVDRNLMTALVMDNMENLFGLKFMQNAMSAQIAIDKKLYGPNLIVSTACAAGAMAAEFAANYIKQGKCDMMITGGSEIFVNEMTTLGFNKLTALSMRNEEPEKAIKPFDKNRDGTILGDGCGIVIMETEENAKKRGARIYARYLGAGNVCEAYSLASPEPRGEHMGMVMTKALDDAKVNPDQIDYVCAHGTATPQNDKCETLGIKLALGDRANHIPINSIKSMVGHTIGAAGGIELCTTALSLYTGIIPPTINLETPDPNCDLFYVPNEAIEKKDMKIAASNSFALGGHNSCLVLEKV